MKKAYLIFGPESSGTRMLTQIMIASGCIGDPDHRQRWDQKLPETEPLIVWRRSLPHGGKMPNIQHMVDGLRANGYEVSALVILRDIHACASAQVRRGHAGSLVEAVSAIMNAWRYAAHFLEQARVPHLFITYESLVLYGTKPLQRLVPDIKIVEQFHIRNENWKYYE